VSVVLMYHALYRGEDTTSIDAEDLPYAVSEQDFVAQLDALIERGHGGANDVGRDDESDASPAVVITFDDGHASNHDIALPHLLERGLHAWFFVTSDFVDRRAGFCSTAQVTALAQAGMTIGSHGTTHAFFDDLDDAAALAEFEDSRTALAGMGGTIDSISFPGGRWNRRTLDLAERAGYRTLFGSTVDIASASALGHGRAADGTPIPRVAIRRTTSLDEFARIVDADPAYYRRHRVVQGGKRLARAVLGNRIYHGLYQSLS